MYNTVGLSQQFAVAVMHWGRGAQPPKCWPGPQIFWFQQQKYAQLKSTLVLYSGEINTRINQCIINDDITDQNPNEGANKAVKPVSLIVRCLLTAVSVVTRQFGSLSIYLFMPELYVLFF